MEYRITDEKPPGRKPIQTAFVWTEKLDALLGGCRQAMAEGKQAYWVCPLVDESEVSDLTAAEDRFKHLRAALGEGVVGVVHGQMPPADKDAPWRALWRVRRPVLVATTVIEVGVNVPNATIMVIERAETFGLLAQLHQLRGEGWGVDQMLPAVCCSINRRCRKRVKTSRDPAPVRGWLSHRPSRPGNARLWRCDCTAQSGLPRFRVAGLRKPRGAHGLGPIRRPHVTDQRPRPEF